VKVNDIKLVCL